MKENVVAARRLVESMYDLESGQTFVRHPDKEDEWLDSALLEDVVKGCPVASVSGQNECEVFSSVPHGHKRKEANRLVLMLTMLGRHHVGD